MLGRTSLLFIVVLFFFSCQQENEKQNTTLLEEDTLIINNFSVFKNDVPETILPLKISCGFDNTAEINTQDYKFAVPTGMQVVSKITRQNDNSIVFYYAAGDILYPYAYSYDCEGKVIDSLELHNGFCAGDPWLESFVWTEINTDLEILMVDTSRYYFFEDPIRKLDSVVVKTTNMRLNKQGSFETISEVFERRL